MRKKKKSGSVFKRLGQKGFTPAPEYPCSLEEVRALVDEWVADGELTLPQTDGPPTKTERESPDFCMYHQHTKHSTANCWTLRNLFAKKVRDGELKFRDEDDQDVRRQPYAGHGGKKAMVVQRTFAEEDDFDDEEEELAYTVSAVHGEEIEEGEDDIREKEVATATYFEESEEIASLEAPANEPDADRYPKVLQGSPKFKWFFDQLGLTAPARLEITKAVIDIAARLNECCVAAEGSVTRTVKRSTNAITFSEGDRKYPFPHNRPLYVTATIHGVEFKRAFLDGGASINIMPLATFKLAGIPEKRMVKQSIPITGFGGEEKRSLGYVNVEVSIGKIHSAVKFHVIDAECSYHVILGRTWQHRYGAVPSSYHQCLKAIWGGEEITVEASERPFEAAEAHYQEAVFFTDLAADAEQTVTKPSGMVIPKWENIKDKEDDQWQVERSDAKKKKKKEAAALESRPLVQGQTSRIKEASVGGQKNAKAGGAGPPPRKIHKVREGGKTTYIL